MLVTYLYLLNIFLNVCRVQVSNNNKNKRKFTLKCIDEDCSNCNCNRPAANLYDQVQSDTESNSMVPIHNSSHNPFQLVAILPSPMPSFDCVAVNLSHKSAHFHFVNSRCNHSNCSNCANQLAAIHNNRTMRVESMEVAECEVLVAATVSEVPYVLVQSLVCTVEVLMLSRKMLGVHLTNQIHLKYKKKEKTFVT